MQPIQEQYRTVQDLVLASLREAILDDTFQPGARLRINEISDSLGVSTMPVRQALPTLESEGFVTRIPQRGYVVTAVTPADVQDLYLIRIEMEKLAIRLGVPQCTEEDIQLLGQIHAEVEHTLNNGATGAFIPLAEQFRDALYALCRRPRLNQLIAELIRSSERYKRIYHRTLRAEGLREEARQGLSRTAGVLRALQVGDSQFIENYVEEGNRRALNLLVELVQSNG